MAKLTKSSNSNREIWKEVYDPNFLLYYFVLLIIKLQNNIFFSWSTISGRLRPWNQAIAIAKLRVFLSPLFIVSSYSVYFTDSKYLYGFLSLGVKLFLQLFDFNSVILSFSHSVIRSSLSNFWSGHSSFMKFWHNTKNTILRCI